MKKLSIGAVVTAIVLTPAGVSFNAYGSINQTPQTYDEAEKSKTEVTPGGNGGLGNVASVVKENQKTINANATILNQVSAKTNEIEGELFKTSKNASDAARDAEQAKNDASWAKGEVTLYNSRIDKNAAQALENKNSINNHETRITNNTIAISTFDNRITQNTNDIQVNRENIWENKQSIIKETNERILGDKQTLQESKAYTDSKYGELSAMIEKNKKDTFAGVAAALAASQVPQVTQGSAFSLGAGAGTYQGQTAVAIGMSARFADDVITKLTVTADTQQRIGVGAGYAVEW